MSPQKQNLRVVNGIFLLNKSRGVSSNHALQRVKHLFGAKKAGHTGILDPLATGVLPVCFGEATKLSRYLLNSEKGYHSIFKLGVETDTADSEGRIISTNDASSITEELIRETMDQFLGNTNQIPPMYSAVKYNGQPLYKYARKGLSINRQPRPIKVYEYKIISFRRGVAADLEVKIRCSKGTYVRGLASDLGQLLRCGAHVSKLHRFAVGPFSDEISISLSELRDSYSQKGITACDERLLPVDYALNAMPQVTIDNKTAARLQKGQSVLLSKGFNLEGEGDIVRVFDNNLTFLGVGSLRNSRVLVPKRLVAAKNIGN
ncbi:MAG: tRNA pseudouridine(55) synthase TruB [Porticoccaceae bacterium]|nr:tRNA pseudouridine(55) synthase TruB [Porticoccaceae bacterium]